MKVFFVVAVAISLVAAFTDVRKGTIPNALTLPPLLAAPFAHAAYAAVMGASKDAAMMEAVSSVAGVLLCGIVPFVLFRMNAMGGGDLKVLCAIGALCRPNVGFEAEAYAFVMATLVAPAKLAYEGKLLGTMRNAGTIAGNWFRSKDKQKTIDAQALTWFKLGPAIFAGTLLATLLHWNE
jgi:prepilin peptidase CpaA